MVGLAFIAVFVAVFELDAVHVVLLEAQEGAVGEIVEVALPFQATVGLPPDAQVEAVLRQRLHIGMAFLEGEILAQAAVYFKEGTVVEGEELLFLCPNGMG